MIINQFIRALHEDELTLASKYTDEKGTDWNKYVLEKEKAGFAKFDQWYELDYSHIKIQIKSKYKFQWEMLIEDVDVNDRKITIHLFLVNEKRSGIDKKGLRELNVGDEEAKIFIRKLWAQDLLSPFLPVGNGISFKATLTQEDNERCELLKIAVEKGKLLMNHMTVLWLNQDEMVAIIHDDEKFTDFTKKY